MFQTLLIANRGEIAVRIARSARELGARVVAVYSEDDANSAHLRAADVAHRLVGWGAAAYLDIEQVVAAAKFHGCDAVHPGYGFLSENSRFAVACRAAGLAFVGPRPELLELFGDKTRARELAATCHVPVLEGTPGATSLDQAQAFLESLGPDGAVMLKALAGGGGRGMRAVTRAEDLAAAYERCRSEAKRSFGEDAVFTERFIPRARHIEVQIVGDGRGVSHLWERECSLQRRNQKLVELAPSPNLPEDLRSRLLAAAQRMAEACAYDSLGTFEFLVDLDRPGTFAFIEANPRLQVEHTVTEEVLDLDLVAIQLRIAAGATLADLDLTQARVPPPRGRAIQLRVNMETLDAQGVVHAGQGTLTAFDPPGGPGVRVDGFGYVGYQTVPAFDSLLAKLVVRSGEPDYAALLSRARRAAAEFTIEGVATSLPFLRRLLDHPDVVADAVHTRFIEAHLAELADGATPTSTAAGTKVDANGWVAVRTALAGAVTEISVQPGDLLRPGGQVAVLEALKMEHPVLSDTGGVVREVRAAAGDQVGEGTALILVEPQDFAAEGEAQAAARDPDRIREDLAEVRRRVAATLDEARADAVQKRHGRGQRTARENVADLCDAESFLEYGQLAVAARRRRNSAEELRALSPADGLVAGIGTVNGAAFGPGRSEVVVMAYDFTIFGGAQGHINHRKADRLIKVAAERRLPLVLFAEGAGGRTGDDPFTVAHLETPTFLDLARLSGRCPLVGIVSGRCFAGNAALLGVCDMIIATEDSNIGMGGPPLIEAGGLGVFAPEQVGPIGVQSQNGVVDIRVADEAAAVLAAQRYLSYFQGALGDWMAEDPRRLREVVPENRRRPYDVRDAARLIADSGSFLELRAEFGRGYVTALIRVEGRPLGLVANNPLHGAGAIDSDGADKAARFLGLCDAHGLPVLSLIDTPGIMVGPEAEKTGLVRHTARLFLAGARRRVPMFAVVLRKAYGLGAIAAAGGRFDAPQFTVSWPTGEFGGMGLEGAVRLGFKRELEAIADPAARKAFFEARVQALYDKGKALNIASAFEIDAVIDPADTRQWLVRAMDVAARTTAPREDGVIDAW